MGCSPNALSPLEERIEGPKGPTEREKGPSSFYCNSDHFQLFFLNNKNKKCTLKYI